MIRHLILLVCILLGGSACSPFQRGVDPAELQYVPEVPYRAQQARDDCGPAALASLLEHRDRQVSLAEITRATYTPVLGGTLLPDLENYARQQGFTTRSGRGDTALLRRNIAAGRPVMVLIETGLWKVSQPHYIVVYGFDDDGFLAHAGTLQGVYIEEETLLPRWEKMNRLYLYLE